MILKIIKALSKQSKLIDAKLVRKNSYDNRLVSLKKISINLRRSSIIFIKKSDGCQMS